MITADPYGISCAGRPWAGTGAGLCERIYTYDSEEQIERCQRCEKPECNNCIGAYWKNRAPRLLAKEQMFIALYESGKTDAEIAAAMGITRATVCYRRKKLGMDPNMARPKSDPCEVCRSRAVCTAHSGTCGEKARYEG